MGSFRFISSLSLILCLIIHHAEGLEPWPQLIDGNNSNCNEVLKIASNSFYSDSFHLYDSISPQGTNSQLVMTAVDFGKPFVINKEVFVVIDDIDPVKLYWQSKAIGGLRFVISEKPFGWQPKVYGVFAIKENVTKAEFLSKYAKNEELPLIEEGWQPVFMLKNSEVWALAVGQQYIPLDDWKAYIPSINTVKPACTIKFYPTIAKITTLLPTAVQKLATLLDNILGSGENDGTLQSTARLRNSIMYAWANVALRPWALKNQSYNSRKQVDNALKRWSHKAPSYRKLYKRILEQYPKAEAALAKYYQVEFKKTPKEATAMARSSLDLAFRSHFVFPKEAPILSPLPKVYSKQSHL